MATPPHNASRPHDGGIAGAQSGWAGKDHRLASTIAQAADNHGPAAPRPRPTAPAHDATARQGLHRTTLARSSSGRCHTCGRTFETLYGAVSHGRSAAHTVEGVYRAVYVYVPLPADDGATVHGREQFRSDGASR